MESKDILEYIIKDCENFNKENIRMDLETLKEFLKDLEVLEILKKVFPKKVLEHELNDAYECNRITKREYDLIKEVLEE